VAGSGVATDAVAKLTLSRRAPILPGVLLVKTRAAVVGAPTGSTGAAGQISYAMMTLAPGTYTLSLDLIGSQRGLTTSTTVMLGSLFMALSIVFPIMRSSKKEQSDRARGGADQKYPDPWMDRAEDRVRPNGERSPGRTPLLDLWIPAQEGARTLPAECNSCARANC
jgi:hypothetical protein